METMRAGQQPVVIEAALNGSRPRSDHPGIPVSPAELAREGRRCADAGATVLHVHARDDAGTWSSDPGLYAEIILALRAAVPGTLLSITSLRPAGVAVAEVVRLLEVLAGDAATRPDLISVNLGHIVAWERTANGSRRTRHFPNGYEEIARIVAACGRLGIGREFGVMDLGFISNAVALKDDGVIPDASWFLLELDSPGYGAGEQVAPATAANYDALATALREQFPLARWAAHGQGIATYAVIRRALADGAHLRVGFEDTVVLEDGRPATSNADQVAWAVAVSRELGREPASVTEARAIIGC